MPLALRFSLRRIRGVALVIAALGAAACGGSSGDMSTGPSTGPGPGTQDPAGSIVGTYRLATVNGEPLNVPFETDGVFADYFDSGEVELKSNGEFRYTLRGRTVIPGMNDIVHNETWTGHYSFHPSAPGEDNGRVTLYDDDGYNNELEVTQISITDVNSMPLSDGGTYDIILVFVRD